MTDAQQIKFDRLTCVIKSYDSTLVAFSGGVDSAFVLRVARDVLGKHCVKAVTADSPSVPRRELENAKKLACELGVEHRVIQTKEFEDPRYLANSEQRCFFCKTELYTRLTVLAGEWRLRTVCDGTHVDDLGDFRPGLRAASQHHIQSPLVAAGFGKAEIRALSRSMGLAVWDKPASPCLSSRVPHREEITAQKLKQIEAGENFLKDLGFCIVRLRHLGETARVELGRDELVRVMDVGLRNEVTNFILSLGFRSVCLEPYGASRVDLEKNLDPAVRTEMTKAGLC